MRPKTRLPDRATYQKAIQVLSQTMQPWRSAALFHQAFTPVVGHEEETDREAERFRERFVRRPGVIKNGPWYALRRWFVPVLPMLSREDYIFLHYSGEIIRWAEMEANRLLPRLAQRNPDADPVTRCATAIRGFRVQGHIARWFEQHYPEFYLPPRGGDVPKPEDFRLKVNGQVYLVDVAQADAAMPLSFRLHPAKMRGADVVIVGYDNEQGVLMCGYRSRPGPLYGKVSKGADVMPIERLLIFLNVAKLGLCWQDFVDTANGKQAEV